MTRDELHAFLIRNGWEQDNWGHYQKTYTSGTVYRFKLQPRVVRLERKTVTPAGKYSPKSSRWVRRASASYDKLSLTSDDKIQGLS